MMMADTLTIGRLVILGLACASCARHAPEPPPRDGEGEEDNDGFRCRREAMIGVIRAYGGVGDRVLEAMRPIRRHRFIPAEYRGVSDPYGDHPCPIGHDQTISQPYIVAYMTEKLALHPGEKVLEVGTGSGYQAAVLAKAGATVYSVERVPELARHARSVLDTEGFAHVHVLNGDGYLGWPEHAPFDAIIVTCAPDDIPVALEHQLAEGGRMILPVGIGEQRLVLLKKRNGRVEREDDIPVRFVPMVHGKP